MAEKADGKQRRKNNLNKHVLYHCMQGALAQLIYNWFVSMSFYNIFLIRWLRSIKMLKKTYVFAF